MALRAVAGGALASGSSVITGGGAGKLLYDTGGTLGETIATYANNGGGSSITLADVSNLGLIQAGVLTLQVNNTALSLKNSGGTAVFGAYSNNNYLILNSTATVAWSADASFSTTPDVFLSRKAAATLQFGNADAATSVAQTISFQGIVAGTSNISGSNATIVGSLSTGSGTSGDIIFQTGGTGAGAAVQNTATTAFTIKGATQQCIFAGTPRINVAPNSVGTGTKTISNGADSSTNFGHYITINMNGTNYFIPCGATAPT